MWLPKNRHPIPGPLWCTIDRVLTRSFLGFCRISENLQTKKFSSQRTEKWQLKSGVANRLLETRIGKTLPWSPVKPGSPALPNASIRLAIELIGPKSCLNITHQMIEEQKLLTKWLLLLAAWASGPRRKS